MNFIFEIPNTCYFLRKLFNQMYKYLASLVFYLIFILCLINARVICENIVSGDQNVDSTTISSPIKLEHFKGDFHIPIT